MKKNMIVKLLILNLSISAANILTFSRLVIPIDMLRYNSVTTAFSVMVIIMSLLIFGYGNYKILFPKYPVPLPDWDDKDILTLPDCEQGIRDYMANNSPTFAASMQEVLGQISRIRKKRASIDNILLDKFDSTEISYQKFTNAVQSVEDTMVINIKNLLNRIMAFDDEEYENLLKSNRPSAKSKINESRQQIFKEYTDFVQTSVDNNEEMLIRLDKLILEISKLNEADLDEIENMQTMKEIDALINDTKWYK